MKSKILLLFIVACSYAVVLAQTDITPARYVFSNQTVGKYTIDATNAGANPPAGWTTPVDNFNNGYVVLAGGPAVFTSLDAAQPAAIRDGLNIVDLGGQVGKVLVMRGKTSTYPVGTAMGAGYAGAWYNLNFYFDKNTTPVLETIRVRLVFSVYENVISATGSSLSKFYTSTWQNNTSPALADVPTTFPSDFFQATDAAGDPLANDNGEAYYDPSKWMVYEFDIQIPDAIGNPSRLKMEILGTAGNMTLFVREIKFTKNPVGTPVVRQLLKLTPGTTALKSITEAMNKLQIAVNGNTVQLLNAGTGNRVDIYNVTGQLYKSFNTNSDNASFSLQNGLYIIKSEGKTVKVNIK